MLVTKVKEQHEVNGKILINKLFIDPSDLMFSIENKTILAYVKKGYLLEVTEIIETVGELGEIIETPTITEKKVTLTVAKLSYSQEEIKGLFDLNGIVFNSNSSNLLIDLFAEAANAIAVYLITADPLNNFGLDIAKWEVI